MEQVTRIGVLTSGGDAQGMNAAVRAVVRAGIVRGAEVYAVCEGYKGMVEGGDLIRPLSWDDVGGILQLGGTVIGTARSAEFREREGRLKAAGNLLANEIDRLVVVGGDGSLTGASLFREEWPGLVDELVANGTISAEVARRHPTLRIVGLVGSIDNDMSGTDMTIGADSALHRITEAIDAISSTAASHQRTFVVEVMGRRCGYLALRSALASGGDWVLIPEDPPEPGWEEPMCENLRLGRELGRRDTKVIVAEGAADRTGAPITSEYVRQVLEERLGEDTRVTVLGHVQRGGSPGAFDRYMATILGVAAASELLGERADEEPKLIGLRNNRVHRSPLMASVERTNDINAAMKAGDFDRAVDLRGGSFRESLKVLKTLTQVVPPQPAAGQQRRRLALLHAGGPAPGMNSVVRVATRMALDQGHRVVGVHYGFEGLIERQLEPLEWMSVSGWSGRGGADLGVSRRELSGKDLYAIARTIEEEEIEGILMIGGWTGYVNVHEMWAARSTFPSFNIPLVCLPASIDNNLPGSEISIGADTALNSIVEAVDKIKQSAVASGRCFVVEVMGRFCGYLAMMGGLATGAERVFTNEEGITLASLMDELSRMIAGFEKGKRLSVLLRNENASETYTTDFIRAMFEEEGGDLFSVRQTILGHLQQGGDPSPFDRILAARLATRCIAIMLTEAGEQVPAAAFIGVRDGSVGLTSFEDFERMVDLSHQRPREQWWWSVKPLVEMLARPDPLAEALVFGGPSAGPTVQDSR